MTSNWKRQGAVCATHEDPDLWQSENNQRRSREAKVLCASCELREPCLDYALERNIGYGIWGGLTPDERRRFARRYLAS